MRKKQVSENKRFDLMGLATAIKFHWKKCALRTVAARARGTSKLDK